MTQYITTSYTLDLILGQKSWIIQTTQKMLIACLLELFFSAVLCRCTLAQGKSGSALPVPAPALAGASFAPALGCACSICILHPAFGVSFHLMHLLWVKKKTMIHALNLPSEA